MPRSCHPSGVPVSSLGTRGSGATLCAALAATLMVGGRGAIEVGGGVSGLPATGGFVNLSTLLLIAGGLLLAIVGAIAFAILSRR